ncbi:MAG: hemolysin activator protein, HlyB family [Crocinitomicaceae bacterium]|nr:hemolysin activator protein, HlyB family [Crocinitomicaceae bacterium]
MRKTVRFGCSLAFLTALIAGEVLAQGFLEMPDTTEVPVFEEESMLLDLDIPSVRDRDPDPQAGPRLNVKEFRLQGVVEFPELGVSRKELIEQVEAIRFELMNEDQLLDTGYTIDEIGQVSDLLADIEKETKDSHVGSLEVQKLVFLIREQRRQRGVTLGMIETVADTITRYYRERGFILARAYIPEQKVRDGVVTLTLLLGELGEVRVENRQRVSESLIERVFKNDIDEPVSSWQIEENLYLINDIPGVDVQGFFQKGTQVGDTRLLVNVKNEDRWAAVLRSDNHGSDKTGEYRMFADFSLLNPSGYGDELHISALTTAEPSNTTYGALSYSSLLYFPRLRGEIGVSTNDFVSRDLLESDTAEFYFTGDSTVLHTSLAYNFKRSRVKNYSMELGFRSVETDLTTVRNGLEQTGLGDDAQIASLSFNWDVLSQKRRHLYKGRVSLSYADIDPGEIGTSLGNNAGSNDELPEKDAAIFNIDLSMLSFFKIPFTKYETRFVQTFGGQYAGKPLSNINQISIAGPTKLRGFAVNSAQFDDAAYLSIDWVFSLPKFGGFEIFGEPINRVLQPYLFVDGGYGRLVEEGQGSLGNVEGSLSDGGVGLKFNHSHFSGSLAVSKALSDDVDSQAEIPTSGVYFDFQYKF